MTTPPPDTRRVIRRSQWAHACQVSAENLRAVAMWCGGHTWGAGVVVPLRHSTPIPGEASAAVGDWVLGLPDGTFEVCAERDFDRAWTTSVGAR